MHPLQKTLHKIEDEYRELHHLEQSLVDFAGLDIDLSRLQGTHASRHAHWFGAGGQPGTPARRARAIHHLILNVAGEGETLRIPGRRAP